MEKVKDQRLLYFHAVCFFLADKCKSHLLIVESVHALTQTTSKASALLTGATLWKNQKILITLIANWIVSLYLVTTGLTNFRLTTDRNKSVHVNSAWFCVSKLIDRCHNQMCGRCVLSWG